MLLSKMIIDDVMQQAKDLENYVIEMRRTFHRNPEIGYQEVRTGETIRQELKKMGIVPVPAARTGVVGTISGAGESPCIALRADMDALALTEENTVEYASAIKGRMHACGHDAHTAMLLGAMKILVGRIAHFNGRVKCIFQPAEETEGGANDIVNEGHVQGTDMAVALHVWSSIPAGRFATRKGPFFAATSKIVITIEGKGGHAAYPHLCIDPTAVGVDIYNAIQKIVSREITPFSPKVISIPGLNGSEAHNVVPERMIMQGTIRSFDDQMFHYLMKRVEEVVSGYSQAWRCTGTLATEGVRYPVLCNDPEAVDCFSPIASALGDLDEAPQTLGGEDFAFIGKTCKAAMFLLGVRNQEKDCTYAHHHPRFNLDESVLWKGTAFYALSALEGLLSMQAKC